MALTAEESAAAASIVANWLWQPAEGHNYRFAHAPRTLTRYYETASMQPDEIRIVIEYLRTQDLGNDKISLLNRTVDFGTGWKSQDAWYQTSPSEKWTNTDSTKVRVYQVLFQAAGDSEDGPYVVEKGCQYKVSHTFYWDVTTMPTVPNSDSGVSYSLQGVVRNRETGLFSCVLEKRERMQQDVADYTTEKTAFATKSEEQHIGVRQGNVAGAGKRASVSNGTIVKRRVTKNADCTSDVHNETTIDTPVTDAVVEVRRSLRGTTEKRVNRNQPNKLTSSGMQVGETRRSEQTESQLWNNEIQKTTGEAGGILSESCEQSVVTHTDVETENVANRPTVKHQTADVNKVVRMEARRTDENTWDVSTTKIVYEPKSTGTLRCGSSEIVRNTKVAINQPELPTSGPGYVNVDRRISASPNDHGSYNTTEETVEYHPHVHTFESGAKNAKIVTTVGRNQLSHVAGVGETNEETSITQSLNDHGSYDYQLRRIVYTPTIDRLSAGSTNARVNIEIGKNQQKPTVSVGEVNEDISITAQRNDHDTYDYQLRKIVYTPSSAQTTVDWATDKATTVITTNDSGLVKQVSHGDASISLNDHGSATTSVTTIVPKTVDSDWIKWNSTTRTRSGIYNHRHGVRIFKNVDNPSSLTSGLTGVEVSINASVNRFGKYDGSISFSELVSWSENSGGSGGGSTTGTATLYQFKHDAIGRTLKRTVTIDTIAFYGVGNEGTESNYRANQKMLSGLSLPPRTYMRSDPQFGNWTAES